MAIYRWDEVLFAQSTSNAPIKNTASAEYSEGLYPAFSATGQDVWLPTHRYEGRGIVVSAVGARCGKSFKADGKWNVVANTHALYVNEDIALRDYCWYALNNEEWWIKAGSGQPFVKLKDSLKRKHCFPPIEEQRKIVEALNKVAQLISIRKEQLAKLDQLVKSRFIELFNGYDETTKLSEVAVVTGGLTKNSKRDQLPLRMPYLRVANVAFASIDVTEMLDIGLTREEYEKTLLEYEDMLFVEGNGSPDQIGRVAIWRNEITPCVHQNHLIKARFNQSKVKPVFAMHYFMSQSGREQIKSKAVSTSGLFTLSVSKVADLLMPVPPMDMQAAFVAFVEQTDKSKLAVQKSLEELEILKKSLMQQYFG